MGYADPYLGGRTPEYINWTFGFQHQWTDTLVTSITYVGSQGHFLPTDGGNPRGLWADQLDPKYLALGTTLSTAGTSACAANGLTCPANFTTGQQLSTALRPFPFQTVSDPFGNVANSNYHSLQISANMRPTHGFTFMANYTWSRAIDDGGYFRTGYPIPAAFSGNGKAYAADRIERSLSTSSQPHHVVITGIWDMPFGRSILASNYLERAVLGGFKFSTIFQAFSGSPLFITSSSCNTNPAQTNYGGSNGACMPSLNPAFTGLARINGKWGSGVTAANFSSTTTPSNHFIDSSAFVANNLYQFGNAPRTGAFNIYGPGNYNLDISLRRSINLHITESSKFSFQAELYNVTNHTQFTVANTIWGNSSFGQVGGQANNPRQAQLSGRIEF
jgi:hypothetical protein